MKKIALVLLISATSFFAFAGKSSKISCQVISNFKEDFGNVKNVQWEERDGYAEATFVVNNKGTKAFYNFDGTPIGRATAITIDMLPEKAKRSFAKKYSGYTVTEAISFVKPQEAAYYISASNNEERVIIKVVNEQVCLYKKLS